MKSLVRYLLPSFYLLLVVCGPVYGMVPALRLFLFYAVLSAAIEGLVCFAALILSLLRHTSIREYRKSIKGLPPVPVRHPVELFIRQAIFVLTVSLLIISGYHFFPGLSLIAFAAWQSLRGMVKAEQERTR